MVSTYAQKQASERYRKKKEAQGYKQRQVYSDDLHWQVLNPLYKWMNGIDFSNLKTVEFDDNGKYIKFIYSESAKDCSELTKQTQDDER